MMRHREQGEQERRDTQAADAIDESGRVMGDLLAVAGELGTYVEELLERAGPSAGQRSGLSHAQHHPSRRPRRG